jgi:DNA-binding transcriptional MerR regulator
MNQFSIRDIENLCGIKAHTLRIWEQRYNLFTPKRKEGRHRVYDNDDLRELLRISFLYHKGHKISRIAELGPAQVHELVEQSCIKDGDHSLFIHQLIEAGLDFDEQKFEKIVNCLVLRVGLEKSIQEVFYPFLERIGMLWMTNHVIPAQEHFVSHIIRKKIILATDGLEIADSGRPPVLIFAPGGEFHEIPLLTANYFFRKYRNRTVYFGANVSMESLQYYLQQHPVSCLYAHIITLLNDTCLDEYMLSLSRQFPDKKIILSGPAARSLNDQPANLNILCSLDEMIALAKKRGAAI